MVQCQPGVSLIPAGFHDVRRDALKSSIEREQPIGVKLSVDNIVWLEEDSTVDWESEPSLASTWKKVESSLAKAKTNDEGLTTVKGKGYTGNNLKHPELKVLVHAYRACLALEAKAENQTTPEQAQSSKRPAGMALHKSKTFKKPKGQPEEDSETD